MSPSKPTPMTARSIYRKVNKMKKLLLPLGTLLLTSTAQAHQPVMDMAPRWEDGYGFQVRHESYGSDTLLDSDSEIANPLGLERFVDKTWFEGVYTFDRSKRVTFKIPYIQQDRIKNIGGAAVKQENSGWGDLILGVPLKLYSNKGAFTQNFGFTPSLRLPTGSTSGDFPISDGSTDLGLSFSYSSETPKYYTLFDAFTWINTEGERNMRAGNTYGLDVNLGYHPYHDDDTNSGAFVMWDVTARYNDDPSSGNLTTASGGARVHTGPLLVLYKDNIMLRTEYKHPLYEKTSGISNSRGSELTFGIGITF